MTTSDKVTHVMDVLFLIGMIVLVVFFARADREHERELAALAGTIQQLEGKIIALENAQGVKTPGPESGAPAPPADR